MSPSSTEIANLLELQRTDSAIDDHGRQRAALTERTQIKEADEILEKLSRLRAKTETSHAAAARSQKAKEDELAGVNAKAEKEEKLLYSGSVSSPKELKALQDEVAMLKRQAGDIETDLLIAMDEADELKKKLDEIDAKNKKITGQREEFEKRLADKESAIDSKVSSLRSKREALLKELPSDLHDRYERMRAAKEGLAVVELLSGGICGGCRRELPATELDHYHKQHDLYPCPHCRRLIVPGGD